jgi:hypothetical protein
MIKKVDIELVKQVLSTPEAALDQIKVQSLLSKLQTLAEENQPERTKTVKRPYAVVISDPDGVIPRGVEFTGWAFQHDEELGILDIPRRLEEVARDYNATRSGQKQPVASVGETIQVAALSLFKGQKLQRKHKDPVAVLITNNKVSQLQSADLEVVTG